MAWKCIRCEASNSDNQENCEVCSFDRFYTKSDLVAELAKVNATQSFQSPIRHEKEQNDRWKSSCIFLVGVLLVVTIICAHYHRLSSEKSVRIDRLVQKNNDTSKQLRNAKQLLELICFVGPKDQSGDGGFISINEGLYFDVFKKCQLYSVDIYPEAQGKITVELFDKSRNIIGDKEVYVFGGKRNKVPLEFTLDIGNSYLLKARANKAVSLYRNINMAKKFPYELPSVIRITNSTLGKGYYYFFYNWQIRILC